MAANPELTPVARQPRGIVNVNGTRVDAWVSWEVNNNDFYEADTFRVCFAISNLPAAFNSAWWASQQEIFIEVFAGFPTDADNYEATNLQSLTYGRVDEIAYDPRTRTLVVTGRDLTATMIDTKTSETFQNMTSSQIAVLFAGRHGLTPVVTATAKLTGKYYQTDQVRSNQQRSEWDLLTALAAEEQFVVYVKGRELHFEPAVETVAEAIIVHPKPTAAEIAAQQAKVAAAKAAFEAQFQKLKDIRAQIDVDIAKYDANPTPEMADQLRADSAAITAQNDSLHKVWAPPYDAADAKLKAMLGQQDVIQRVTNAYELKWEEPGQAGGSFSFNGKEISFTRALTLARGIVVTVMSVSPKTGKPIKVTFPQKKTTISPGASAPVAQQYSYTFAHLTYEKALQKAQQLHAEISKHEVKLHATLQGDNILQVNSLISVIGTNTAFDQTYFPESITREMSFTEGYVMTVSAKNHSPQSVPAL